MKKIILKTFFVLILPIMVIVSCQEENLPKANFNTNTVTSFDVVASHGKVVLSWVKPIEGTPTAYRVSWTPGETVDLESTVTSYEITNLIAKETYAISVQAIYEGNIVSGKKGENINIPDEINFEALPDLGLVELQWNTPSRSDLIGYVLNIGEGTELIQLDKDATSYLVTDLENDSEYTFILTPKFTDGLGNPLELRATPGFSIVYTEVTDIPFTATNDSTIVFADIDGDADLDLLILGDTGAGFIAELFRNDGSGGYSLITGTPFTGIERGDAVFGDVDGDGDLDVIISGDPGPDQITELFLNDGTGTFTISTTHSFSGVRGGSALALADIDGDADLDLLLTGWGGSSKISELHINDSSGAFTLDATAPFKGHDNGSIDFADVDGDGDLDVLLTGKEQVSGLALSELYLNNGSGAFTLDETATATIDNVRNSDAQFADIDGDGDQDLIVSGYDDSANVTKLYTNVGGVFTEHAVLRNYNKPDLDFADIDNDGDLDILIIGKEGTSGVAETDTYFNDGSGSFMLKSNSLLGMRVGDIGVEDIDGDGDNDVIVSGWDETSRNIKLYKQE